MKKYLIQILAIISGMAFIMLCGLALLGPFADPIWVPCDNPNHSFNPFVAEVYQMD